MARKKQEAAPSKKSAKKAAPKSKPEAKSPKKSAASKPEPKKRTMHAVVADATVLGAFDGGKLLTKKELVAACGGDIVAVTKAVNKLRGEGKVIATGNSRSTVYSRAA